jgi:hypothetical protein
MQSRLVILTWLIAAMGVPAQTSTTPRGQIDLFSRAITLFGGRTLEPSDYPSTVAGFGKYLEAVGVHAIRASDLTTPYHRGVAAKLGFDAFLPPKKWWPRGAALALLTERLNRAAGEHVAIRNWWRPAAYNRDTAVGGAKNGDHPTANALDLDYSSVAARAGAERALRTLDAEAPWLHLSLGLGPRTTHVGIGSARGHREWHYTGWTPAGSFPRPESQPGGDREVVGPGRFRVHREITALDKSSYEHPIDFPDQAMSPGILVAETVLEAIAPDGVKMCRGAESPATTATSMPATPECPGPVPETSA